MSDTSTSILELRVDPPTRQRRLSVFFRFFMLIPHWVVFEFVNFAMGVCVFLGWFAAIFTGRNPFFRFISGTLRWNVRVLAYGYLLTDQYPPFTMESESNYPVDISIEQGRLGRASVFFRAILAIPASLLVGIVTMGAGVFTFFAWFITLVKGRLPEPLHNALTSTLRFWSRCYAYYYLLQNPYPSRLFGDGTLDQTTPTTPTPTGSSAIDLATKYGTGSTTSPSSASSDVDLAVKYGAGSSIEPPVHVPSAVTPAWPGPDVTGSSSSTWAPYPTSSDTAPTSSTPWFLALTTGGRRLLVWFIVIGVLAYPGLIITEAVVLHGAVHSLDNSLWSSEYEGDIASLSHAVVIAEVDLSARPVSWASVTAACTQIGQSISELAGVPPYPVSGTDTDRTEGMALLYAGTLTCTARAIPLRNSADIARVLAAYRAAHQRLATFISEIPQP